MKIMITESQYRILTEQYSEEQLKTKYVDSGLVPENQFNEIISEFNKPFYRGWILKMVSEGNIKYEDVYKFKHYFNVFEKFKRHFPIKDLGQIKTFDDVAEFERKSKDMLLKQQENEQGDISDKKNLVSLNDIQKLESVGIKYLGMVDGLQSFQVPPEVKDSKEAWNVYREILGKCSGRDKGQIVSICTMAGFESFRNYLKANPGSSYYVFYNLGDQKSPYQFHYDTDQFMDKNDDDISESKLFVNLSKFLLKKGLNEKYIPIYHREKIGFKLSDDEKKSINQIKYVLNKLVDEMVGLKEPKNGNRYFKFKSDEYDDFIFIGYDGLSFKYGSVSRFLKNNGVNYYNGLGKWSNRVLLNLINNKFPNLNLELSTMLSVLPESNFKW